MATEKKRYFINPSLLQKGKQKRKNARIDVNIEGRYALEEGGTAYNCTICSISTGGVAILATVALVEGDIVIISFLLDGEP
ncbi:MAG: PilZ domain-containing protein, partial [Actinomycetia bacterium]|nr:PilZ domain-containing protein [Actinomycetes bacterium]